MADEHSDEIVRELRRIRTALYLLALVGSLISFMVAMNFWAESTRPPGGNWQQQQDLQNIRGELLGIREELRLSRQPSSTRFPPLPPVVVPGGKPDAGKKNQGK